MIAQQRFNVSWWLVWRCHIRFPSSPSARCLVFFYLFNMFYSPRYTLYDRGLVLLKRNSPFSPSRIYYEIFPLLCFRTLTLSHRYNRGLPPLGCHWINRPGIDHRWSSTHSQDNGRCCFLRWAEYSKDSRNDNRLTGDTRAERRLWGSGWYDGLVCGSECGRQEEDNGTTGFERRSREWRWECGCYTLLEVE